MVDTRGYSGFELYRRLLLEARPCWLHIFGLFLLSLLSIPLALLTPLPLKLVVDSVIGTHPLPSFSRAFGLDDDPPNPESVLLFAVGLTVALALLGGLQALANYMLRTQVGEKLALSFRAKLFRHTQRLSFLYHDSVGISDSIYRIQYDAPAIQWIAIEGVIPFLTAGITLIGMLVVIIRIDWQLALVALGTAPALYLATRYFGPRIRTRWYEIRNLETDAFSVVQETLASLRLVQAFRQEDRERDRFVKQSSVSMRTRLRAPLSESMLDLVVGLRQRLALLSCFTSA
jgi:ATP-binding cassette, subfamily B, bacterial